MKTSQTIRMTAICTLAMLANVGCAQSNDLEAQINSLLPSMISLEAGSFIMGDSWQEGDSNELPTREVQVPAFAIASHEVTFDLYDLFATSTGRALPNDEGWGRGNHPVINVTWVDATALAEWLSEQTGRSFRLPSEAEWEYAARAGTTTPFANGTNINREYGNYGPSDCCARGPGQSGRDIWDYTAPVGSFEPNQWGLHDTVGNVWEWTADCWNESYDGAPSDGSPWLEGDCARAPLKGGSWSHYSRNIRPANRNENLRENTGNGYGIRLAEDI